MRTLQFLLGIAVLVCGMSSHADVPSLPFYYMEMSYGSCSVNAEIQEALEVDKADQFNFGMGVSTSCFNGAYKIYGLFVANRADQIQDLQNYVKEKNGLVIRDRKLQLNRVTKMWGQIRIWVRGYSTGFEQTSEPIVLTTLDEAQDFDKKFLKYFRAKTIDPMYELIENLFGTDRLADFKRGLKGAPKVESYSTVYFQFENGSVEDYFLPEYLAWTCEYGDATCPFK